MLLLLLQHLLVTALLAVWVFVLSRAFAKHAALCHLLWLIVLCKFLVPPLWSPWSISLTSRRPSRNELTLAATVDTVISETTLAEVELHTEFDTETAVNTRSPTIAERSFATFAGLPWRSGGIVIWILGSVVLAVRHFRSIRQMQRLLRQGQPPPKRVEAALQHVSRQLGSTPPPIISTNVASSPFVWSLSGQIIWPNNDVALTDEQIQLVLAHELAHIRRRDHWVALLESVGWLVWWWNPIYWWTVANLRHCAECACDLRVVQQQPSLRGVYSRLLIRLAAVAARSQVCGSPVALGISASRKRFEERLTLVMHGNSRMLPPVMSIPAVALMAVVTLLAVPSVHIRNVAATPDTEGTTTDAWDVLVESTITDETLSDAPGTSASHQLVAVPRKPMSARMTMLRMTMTWAGKSGSGAYELWWS